MSVCAGKALDCEVGRVLRYTWVHALSLNNTDCVIWETMGSTVLTSQDGGGN